MNILESLTDRYLEPYELVSHIHCGFKLKKVDFNIVTSLPLVVLYFTTFVFLKPEEFYTLSIFLVLAFLK